ncbi:DUF6090 family protein [Algoriphagus sp. SE2]|uniref:DUF6090 family protein n=1 Tax=Algoriphagus sp. SE2 TaxID=3141536 RepID=UPI0031CD707E
MIKFFRKIRQNLLSEGKTGKYLKYAIGEIVLVVIGILVALQINNWNQTRLNRSFEVTMLREIKSSLEQDVNYYDGFKSRVERKRQGIQELLAMIASNKTYPDTVLLESYNKMTWGNLFVYNKGGYEGIKSVGLDKISNDSLRRKIIKIYEVDFPGAISYYEMMEARHSNEDYKLQLHNSLWKRVQIQLPDNSYKIVSRPINNESFLKQPELIDRIKIAQDILSYTQFQMPILENAIKEGIDIVNKEIDKLEKSD